MKNRIHQLFEKKKSQILSVYFTAGYPNLEDSVTLIKNLEKSGIDMIEVGFPFSDPLADGPVIQQSSQKAIENGMTLALLFEQLKEIRAHCSIPLVFMGYLNPVLQFGEARFIEKCSKIGVDGIIIPDMPLDYYKENIQSLCSVHNISNILLITPETQEARIKTIDAASDGFIYMVSSNSITGANKVIDAQFDYFKRVQNMALKNPTITGFGIRNQETFANVCKYSSGAIVGSAFIQHISENGTSLDSVQNFIKSIRP